MKITKNELKQIIKEEMVKMAEENKEKPLSLLVRWNRWAKNTGNRQVDQDYINRAIAMVKADEEKWGEAWYKQLIKIADWEKANGLSRSDRAAKKKPATKPTTKTTRVSGTEPPHEMKTAVKDGYVIATATTKDGVVGTGKAKIRGKAGRYTAESAAKLRAKVALMKAVSKPSTQRTARSKPSTQRTTRGGVPPQ